MKSKEEIVEELVNHLQSVKYEDLEWLAESAFDEGRNSVIEHAYKAGQESIIGLLRKAFDAGRESMVITYGMIVEDPDEAFNQFLKENNIEI